MPLLRLLALLACWLAVPTVHAQGSQGSSGTTQPAPARVWVNTSSKVYHCPGTQWYGRTNRGEYLLETVARERGNRPANGRTCGPLPNVADPATPRAAAAPLAAVGSASSPASTPRASVRVWVNTASRVYHCPGTRWYGATKAGTYMTQSAARSAGHRPANGREC